MIAGGTRAFRHAHTIDHFQLKLNGVAQGIGRGEIEVVHIEEAAQLFPDFAEEIFLIKGGAEGAADFIENVELLGAARSLLNEVTVFDGHADLVAEGEEQAQFGGSKAAIVRRAEEEES